MAGETNYDLIFSLPPGGSNLLFGEEQSGALSAEITLFGQFPELSVSAHIRPDAFATIGADFPQLEFQAIVRPTVLAQATFMLPGLVAASELVYDARVSRPTVCEAETRQQGAAPVQALTASRHQMGETCRSGFQTRFQPALKESGSVEHKLPGVLVTSDQVVVVPYQSADLLRSGSGLTFSEMVRDVRPLLRGVYQSAQHLSSYSLYDWAGLRRTERMGDLLRHQNAGKRSISRNSGFGLPIEIRRGGDQLYQDARKPPQGLDWIGPPPPVPPVCYLPSTKLVFSFESANGDPGLLFQCDYVAPIDPENPPAETGIVVPVRRAYIIMNEVRLFKVDGNVELPVLSLSLDIDMDSWAWGFNATLPAESLQYVSSTGVNAPIELDAVVNGEHYILLAESVTRTRTFGRASLQVSGRGQSAYLASPYSPVKNFFNTETRTAQQLMLDALTTNGVSIGWEIDWTISDWSVPGNVWSERGSYMDAVNSIANSVGAYVLPHPSLRKLSIKPRYPVLPWNWASSTSDIELPADVVDTESVKWMEKPSYNGVYVSGTSNGVLGHVKRAGSAGDYLASMVTNPLITQASAARMAGEAILSDTGRMSMLTLSLPVLPETGIIKPGKMIRYVDNGVPILGLVKGVSVSMSKQPTLRQTIEVEVHA